MEREDQLNFVVFPNIHLPQEILVKILSYLSNRDILRNVARVSRNFYQIAHDTHLLRRIEFRFDGIQRDWTNYRKEKYFHDFVEMAKKSQKLKFLSIKILAHETTDNSRYVRPREIFDGLSSNKHQFLEEFHLTNKSFNWFPFFVKNVLGFLDKCPKLKIIKLVKIKLDFKFNNGNAILKELEKSELKSLEEFHVNFSASGTSNQFLGIKSFLNIISKKPNVQRIFLTLHKESLGIEQIKSFCQEFSLKNKVKIRVLVGTSYNEF